MSGTLTARQVVTLSPVMPVATFDDERGAVLAAKALLRGGIRVLEITLRTPRAARCIAAVAQEVPGIVVGAGTVRTAQDIASADIAGAQFLVSPGVTPLLLDGLAASGLPFLPGASSVSDVMRLLERGVDTAKFFPAAAAGGPDFLRAVAAPLPDMLFCPTGGISAATAPAYLSCPNVACVGGSWLTDRTLLDAGLFEIIAQRASEAAALAV